MEIKDLYWGYSHVNGSIQAKRYFDQRDLQDAQESDFVDIIVGPFLANNRTEALDYIKKQINKIQWQN
jgi:hypothetical protein